MYVENLENNYHTHRLSIINELIPQNLYKKGKKVFDFGCGNAMLFKKFLDSGAKISGIDISKEMIKQASEFLLNNGYSNELASFGDVNHLLTIPDESLDAVLSFNVLAYLSCEEEQIFYREASRIIKPGGFLIVTHSNELFDMFSLNKFTIEFFENNFIQDKEYFGKLENILSNTNNLPENKITYNIRENPLSYKYKLNNFNFIEKRQ